MTIRFLKCFQIELVKWILIELVIDIICVPSSALYMALSCQLKRNSSQTLPGEVMTPGIWGQTFGSGSSWANVVTQPSSLPYNISYNISYPNR